MITHLSPRRMNITESNYNAVLIETCCMYCLNRRTLQRSSRLRDITNPNHYLYHVAHIGNEQLMDEHILASLFLLRQAKIL